MRAFQWLGSVAIFVTCGLFFAGCQTGGSVAGNEGGSAPVNKEEELQYQKAVMRCYKTGGTRVVKIMGTLRCY